MTRTTVTRTIDTPIDLVFQTVANINDLSKAIPHIERVEFLSDVTSGVSMWFRETRMMRGKETTVELEVTEYVENDHVRIVSDTHGTVWDTVFTVKEVKGGTQLTMVMDAKACKLMSRIMNPIAKGMIKKAIEKAIEKDMDAAKAYCEGLAVEA